MYTHIHTYIYMHILYTYVYTSVYMNMYVYMHIYIYIYIYTYDDACAWTIGYFSLRCHQTWLAGNPQNNSRMEDDPAGHLTGGHWGMGNLLATSSCRF